MPLPIPETQIAPLPAKGLCFLKTAAIDARQVQQSRCLAL
jgi:hypothetical protein